MSQEDFWVLFSKKLAGEATAAELEELEKLVRQHPEWQYALQNLEDIWHSKQPAATAEEEEAWLQHVQRMTENNIPFENEPATNDAGPDTTLPRKRSFLKIVTAVGIAASLVLVFLLVLRKPPGKKTDALAQQEVKVISTRPGAKSSFQLPDGSTVWLNAGSKLTYQKDFSGNTREVTLSGEGFFDVVKNPQKPFLIHAGNIDIRVLGTAFNVKAYPEDKTSEISLIRGRIEVSLKNRSNDRISLSPNEKLVVDNETTTGKATATPGTPGEPLIAVNKLQHDPKDSTVAEIQWIDNKLVFNNESFREVATRMERWYGVEIIIDDPALEEKRLTGNFEQETIEQAMEALTITTPFVFERKGNKIIIHR